MTAREAFLTYSQALDRGDFATMASMLDEDFRLEGAGLDGIGKADFIAAMKAQMMAFPDYSENPTDVEERFTLSPMFPALSWARSHCRA